MQISDTTYFNLWFDNLMRYQSTFYLYLLIVTLQFSNLPVGRQVNTSSNLQINTSPNHFSNNSNISFKIFLSSKSYFTPCISWYFSCPLPATKIISSLLARLTAVLIASFLSGIEMTFFFVTAFTPACISFKISSGSSLRGLSEVKITLSLYSQATSAMTGRLVLSLSPPQPTTVMICLSSCLNFFIVASTFNRASGVCA